MIQVEAENRLSVHFFNSSSSGKNDIHTFTKILKVCKAEVEKPGFKNLFQDDEKELILNMCKEIISDE